MKNPLYITIIKALFAALCLITSAVATAQDVQLSWAKHMGSVSTNYSNSIAVDASGDVYTTGFFWGTVDFDPGEGIANLVSDGGARDIFISKLDADGKYKWAKRIGSTGFDYGNSIAVDASGNVYITGSFQGEVDFDPGEGIANLTSKGNSDIFIIKLDVNGNYLWAKQIGGTGSDSGTSIALDASGNVYTTGYFEYEVDFDPGEGIANLTSWGGDVFFISKLNAGGNFVWAKSTYARSQSIAVDASGNVYTTGYFSGTVDFDPGGGTANLTSNESSNIFISKLNTAGNYVWAKHIGGAEEGLGRSIAIDVSGNVYITGRFSGTVYFDPKEGVTSLEAAGSSDILVSKLNSHGDYLWAKSMGGPGFDVGNSIAIDASGNVYTTGSFIRDGSFTGGYADFDPGEGTAYLKPDGGSDIFISKLDAAGNYMWAKRVGAGDNDSGSSIAVDGSGNIYATGYFTGTVDFDPNIGTFAMTATGDTDIFVLKLSPQEQSPVVVNARFTTHLGWCADCDQELFKIEDINDRNQYLAYVYGDALTSSAGKFAVWWDGSAWKGQLADKSNFTGGSWFSNSTYTYNGLNTSPKPPCTGWSSGFSLSGDCVSPSVAVQVPLGAPAMNASAAQTTGLVNGKNAYDIPVTGGAESEKVTVQWNATLSRWEMVLVSPSARIAAETVMSYNVGDAGVNPPCGGWSDGYALSGDICSAGPLPVTLLSFSASLTDSKNEVRLNWSTTSENNAWYYGLERSRDAKLFEEIARVSSTGNTREITHYIHTDETPLRGRNYYRLRQVDRDDSFTYSPIVSVLTGAAGAPYPNPARGGVIRVEASRGAALKLTDLSGREIPFITQRIDEALTEIRPAQNLQPGVYVVSVDGTGHRVVVAP